MKQSETAAAINVEIGRRLRCIREAQVPLITIEMAGELAGMRKQALGSIERGKQRATGADIVLLAQLYGIEPWKILHENWCELTIGSK